MKWGRVKTIIIFILLAVNVTVGGNLLFFSITQKNQWAQAVNNAIIILEKNNIHIEKGQVPNERTLYTLTQIRDDILEQQTIAKLLGQEYSWESLGGGMIRYTAKSGNTAFLRNGGFVELEIALDQEYPKTKNEAVRKIKKIFSDGGISLSRNSFILSDDERIAMQIEQYIQGDKIYNASLDAEIIDGKAVISGRFAIGDQYISKKSSKKQAELLILMAQNIEAYFEKDSQIIVDSIECGRLMSTGQAGSIVLTPVWKILANGTTLYLDMTTGTFVEPE